MSDNLTKEEIDAAAAEFKAAHIDSNTVLIDNIDGAYEYLHFDEDGSVQTQVWDDLTALQDECKARFNEPVDRKSEFRHFARLPFSFLQQWGREKYGITDPVWFYRKEYEGLVLRAAHDRDAAQFRTAPGFYMRKGGA
jgi:hypothetical protein